MGKSLVKLAKGMGKSTQVKKPENKVVEKPKTLEEERDLKAKAKVIELLQDVDLEPKKVKNEEIFEFSNEEMKGKDWLQEQVGLLSSENELLKNDLANAKNDYAKIFAENQQLKSGGSIQNDSEIKETITKIFHELQSNYMNMGTNSTPRQEVIPAGTPNFRIAPIAFMNRLIMYFPFLQKEKRF